MTKTALVTGGAIRIGREICLTLADAGWNLVVHYRSSSTQVEELADIIRTRGRAVHLVQADLQNESDVSAIFPALTANGIHVDALINNASLFEKDTLAELAKANWDSHMAVNCFAPLQLMRDFAAQYKGDGGNIINITDGLHGWSISPMFFSYAMSKLALANATELLTRSLAPRIRINAIAPGPMLEGAQDKPDTFNKLRKILPLQRTGTPKEIGDAVLYILSASSLTGQTIKLSGGIHTLPQWGV